MMEREREREGERERERGVWRCSTLQEAVSQQGEREREPVGGKTVYR